MFFRNSDWRGENKRNYCVHKRSLMNRNWLILFLIPTLAWSELSCLQPRPEFFKIEVEWILLKRWIPLSPLNLMWAVETCGHFYSLYLLPKSIRRKIWEIFAFSTLKRTVPYPSPLQMELKSWNLVCRLGRDHRWTFRRFWLSIPIVPFCSWKKFF